MTLTHMLFVLKKRLNQAVPHTSGSSGRSKAVVLLLLNYCLLLLPLFVRVLFCYAVLSVHSSFAIILMGKRVLVALL